MRYRITTVSLIVIVITTVFQISLISATSIEEWGGDSNAWSQVEGAEQKQNTIGQVLQASRATVQAVNPNVSNKANKQHSIFLPLLSRGTTSHPANPNASEDAKKVLSYIASLPDRPDKRVISGQFVGHGEGIVVGGYGWNQWIKGLHGATGKWPAMIGADYYKPWDTSRQDTSIVNGTLIEYWRAGGLVTLCCHINNPWTGGGCFNRDNPGWDPGSVDLMDLITPGSSVYETWIDELDYIAAGLSELRDAGVVVVWRPLHEMNYEGCFWWDFGTGEYSDREGYKEVWRHMFSYFSNEKGLDNLLWVYAPSAKQGTWRPVDWCYPGDGYVDIVGVDMYEDPITIAVDGYERLVATGKPFAFGEAGPGTTKDGSWSNMNIINSIRARYPKVTYWQSWLDWSGNTLSMVNNQNAQELLDDPWVITRDELDWGSEPSP